MTVLRWCCTVVGPVFGNSMCCRFEQGNWSRRVGHAGILKLESWGNSGGERRREEVCFQAEDEMDARLRNECALLGGKGHRTLDQVILFQRPGPSSYINEPARHFMFSNSG